MKTEELSKEAQAILAELRPFIAREVAELTKDCSRRKKMTVTVAPSGGVIGVAEAYGNTIMIPYTSSASGAGVGSYVWCEYAYGLTNLRAVELA